MRLSDLARRSGVPTATIKYYLREGLLPPGERVTASRAEYTEAHLRRLRLVRALIQVGGMSVAATMDVLRAADDDRLDQHQRFGAAQHALMSGQPPVPEPEPGSRARATVDELLAETGWGDCPDTPPYRMLVNAVATLERLGYPCDLAHLRPYAAAVAPLAAHDVQVLTGYPSGEEQLEAMVALTVLNEPVLLALRRIGHAYASGAVFGTHPPAGGSGGPAGGDHPGPSAG